MKVEGLKVFLGAQKFRSKQRLCMDNLSLPCFCGNVGYGEIWRVITSFGPAIWLALGQSLTSH